MRVVLAYGRAGLAVELPDDRTDVVEPRDVPGLPHEPAAIAAALRAPLGTLPLRALADPDDDVVIVVNDGTRPMPSARAAPARSPSPCSDTSPSVDGPATCPLSRVRPTRRR